MAQSSCNHESCIEESRTRVLVTSDTQRDSMEEGECGREAGREPEEENTIKEAKRANGVECRL